MPLSRRLTAVAALGAIALMTAACGSGGTASETQSTASGGDAATTADGSSLPMSGAATVDVALSKTSEFSLDPSAETVPAGAVAFTVVNDGTMVHEMVVVKTDKTPEQLTEPDGTANETGSVGEVADLAPGDSNAVTLDLKPGRYVLLCNLPGHYAAGMYHTFAVTQ